MAYQVADPFSNLAQIAMWKREQSRLDEQNALARALQQRQLADYDRQRQMEEQTMGARNALATGMGDFSLPDMSGPNRGNVPGMANALADARAYVGDVQGRFPMANIDYSAELNQFGNQYQQQNPQPTLIGGQDTGYFSYVPGAVPKPVIAAPTKTKTPTKTVDFGGYVREYLEDGTYRDTKKTLAPKDASGGEGGTAPKPMPAAAVRLQNEELDALSTAKNIQADLGALRAQVDSGKIDLGPVRNLASRAQNFAGMSTEQSRNFATLQSSLEKMRNDSLRLNKGVQTEGDAQRAWNEIFANVNDTKLVSDRLKEIEAINARAANLRRMNIDNIRKNYGHPPLDTAEIEAPATVIDAGTTPDLAAAAKAELARRRGGK